MLELFLLAVAAYIGWKALSSLLAPKKPKAPPPAERVKKLALTRQGLTLEKEGDGTELIRAGEFADFTILDRQRPHPYAVTLHTGGEPREIRITEQGLDDIEEIVKKLNKRFGTGVARDAERLVERFQRWAVDEYLRDRNIRELEDLASPILIRFERSREVWERMLDKTTLSTLREVSARLPLAGSYGRVYGNRGRIRRAYEEEALKKQREFYDKVEKNPLTRDQRLAVVRNNDRNLVLAAAGTGKTSVVVAKALDLVDRKAAKPSEILVLAYNRKAKEELQARVGERAKQASKKKATGLKIKTFHALGKEILAAVGEPHSLSPLADDKQGFETWVTEWLLDYIYSSEGGLRRFLDTLYQPCDEFRFRSRQEYEQYVRDNEYRTLQGEKVKSFGEVLIANWLFLHSVEYKYEPQYSPLQRVATGVSFRPYRPDFRIGPEERGIYLEHFGIDRDGNTRPDIDRAKYHEGMKWKEEIHREHGTTLLKTFYYNMVDETLNKRLQTLMEEQGIKTTCLSHEDILETLQKGKVITNRAKLLKGCLEAIRGGYLGAEEIEERLISKAFNSLGSTQAKQLAQTWVEVLTKLEEDYLAELREQEVIDFDDMILRATKAVQDGRYRPEWRHIIVDEFQDISAARERLIDLLMKFGPNPTLTAVGDDWQAIYRFSGGELRFTTQFEQDAPASVTRLGKTFRYNSSIADTAGTFVMKNPEQYRKSILTADKAREPQVILLDDSVKKGDEDGPVRNMEEKVERVLDKIAKEDPKGSVLVLARYKHLRDNCRKHIGRKHKERDIRYLTIHSAKGLEADYCILVGLSSGRFGFPSYIRDEAVLEALLPPLDPFLHAEERRLFYVALTRARHKSYIIANTFGTSEFVEELLSSDEYKLRIHSETFQDSNLREMFRCPNCKDSRFERRSGSNGDYYQCPVCLVKPRDCQRCGAPSLDGPYKSKCRNPNCGHSMDVCDRCGRPMKVRDGRHGKFLGCTGYRIDDCDNTRPLDGRRRRRR